MKKIILPLVCLCALLLSGCGGDSARTALYAENDDGSLERLEPIKTSGGAEAAQTLAQQEAIRGALLEMDFIDDAVVFLGEGEDGTMFNVMLSGSALEENIDDIVDLLTRSIVEPDLASSMITDFDNNVLYDGS